MALKMILKLEKLGTKHYRKMQNRSNEQMILKCYYLLVLEKIY